MKTILLEFIPPGRRPAAESSQATIQTKIVGNQRSVAKWPRSFAPASKNEPDEVAVKPEWED